MNRYGAWMRILVLVVLLGALLAAVIVWLSMPRLLAVSPQDGESDVSASAPLTMQFSQPMQEDTVESRLSIDPVIPGRYTWEGSRLTFTPNEPWPAGQVVRVTLKGGARSTRFLSLPLSRGVAWSFITRRPRLAFLFPSSGPANLYVRDLIEGANQALTELSDGVQDYIVAPGGERIVFSARSPQGGSDLYFLDLHAAAPVPTSQDAPPASPRPQQMLSCAPAACRLPSISPDGAFLAYERSDAPTAGQTARPQVFYAPLSGDPPAVGQSLPAGDPLHESTHPAWSPHGQLTFYDADDRAFVVATPGEAEQTQYANDTGQPGSWQPAGQAFVAPEIGFLDANVSSAVQQNLERLANSHLMWYPWPSAATVDLSQEEALEDAVPAFAPDGSQLAFARKYLDTRRWSPGRQIWLMEMDARMTRALTDAPDYNHFDFAWSPDSQKLAYVRFNQSLMTEPPEIWVMDVTTGEQQLWIAGGYSPQWIP